MAYLYIDMEEGSGEKTKGVRKLNGWRDLFWFDWEKSFVNNVWGSSGRAVFGSFAAGVFGLAVLTLSLLAASNPMQVLPLEMAATSSAKQVIVAEYYLPYPGILPDSPLYKLKAARDRIVLWLTIDREAKAEKRLQLADKRINAAIALVDGGKIDLGVSTATKAEKYLAESVETTYELVREGRDVKSLLLTLAKASAKHSLVMEDLIAKTEGNNRIVLEKTLTGTNTLQEMVDQALRDSK